MRANARSHLVASALSVKSNERTRDDASTPAAVVNCGVGTGADLRRNMASHKRLRTPRLGRFAPAPRTHLELGSAHVGVGVRLSKTSQTMSRTFFHIACEGYASRAPPCRRRAAFTKHAVCRPGAHLDLRNETGPVHCDSRMRCYRCSRLLGEDGRKTAAITTDSQTNWPKQHASKPGTNLQPALVQWMLVGKAASRRHRSGKPVAGDPAYVACRS